MKKSNLKFMVGFFAFVFTLISVSAGGLMIEQNQTLSINKTYNTDYNVQINIKNLDTFDFFNISFEDNPYITIQEIPKLASGNNITVLATINSNEDFIGSVRLKGFYEAELGTLNQSHNIFYGDTGISKCDFSIYEGDTVIWTNQYTFDTTIKKLTTSQVLASLTQSESFSYKFNSPESFRYDIRRYDFPYNGPCTITVLDTEGKVNNPEFDGLYQMEIKIVYPSTTLEINNPISSYEVEYNQEQEGLLTLINNGQETARAINLSGQGFTFTDNHFDLGVGKSRVIGYNIKPLRFISNTNQTNKNYTLNISVNGNFNSLTIPIEVFIPYANILTKESSGITYDDFKNYLEYCTLYPDDLLCPKKTIEYVYLNSSEQEINFTMTQSQWDQFVRFNFDSIDKQDEKISRLTEIIDALNQTLQGIDERDGVQTEAVVKLASTQEKEQEITEGTLITTLVILIAIVSIILVLHIRRKKSKSYLEAYQ